MKKLLSLLLVVVLVSAVLAVTVTADSTVSQWEDGANIDVLTDGYTGVGEIHGYENNNAKLYGRSNSVVEETADSFVVAIEETSFDAITLYALDYASGCVMLPKSLKFVVNGESFDAVITPNEKNITTIKAELGKTVTASEITVEAVMGKSPYEFAIFNMYTELVVNEVEVGGDDNAVEEAMKEKLGEKIDGAVVDYVIEAPATYKAGDEITVKVYARNITVENDVNGIHIVEFTLYYDNTKLLITNDIDEENDNTLVCVEKVPSSWKENFSRVNNDYSEDNEEGTEVNPLNDGVITASLCTAQATTAAAVNEDDQIIFAFTFKVLEGAKGDLGFVIPHAETEAAINTKAGNEMYTANGDYAITAEATGEPETSEPETSEPETSEPETSKPETSKPETSEPETSEPETSEPETSEPATSEPETSEPATSEPATSEAESSEAESSDSEVTDPGDASSMIIFVIIALVAIAGSAIVVKNRK